MPHPSQDTSGITKKENHTDSSSSSHYAPVEEKKQRRIYGYAVLGAVIFHASIIYLLGNSSSPIGGLGEDENSDGTITVTLDSSLPSNNDLNFLDTTEEESVNEYLENNEDFITPEIEEEIFSLDENPNQIIEPLSSDIPEIPSHLPDAQVALNVPLDFTPPTPVKKSVRPSQRRTGQSSHSGAGSSSGEGGAGNNSAVILPRYKSNPKPPYPDQARQNSKEGIVKVRITLNDSGTPISVTIIQSSGHPELDQSAIAFIKAKWEFYPAQKDGKNIPWAVIVPVVFKLDR